MVVPQGIQWFEATCRRASFFARDIKRPSEPFIKILHCGLVPLVNTWTSWFCCMNFPFKPVVYLLLLSAPTLMNLRGTVWYFVGKHEFTCSKMAYTATWILTVAWLQKALVCMKADLVTDIIAFWLPKTCPETLLRRALSSLYGAFICIHKWSWMWHVYIYIFIIL